MDEGRVSLLREWNTYRVIFTYDMVTVGTFIFLPLAFINQNIALLLIQAEENAWREVEELHDEAQRRGEEYMNAMFKITELPSRDERRQERWLVDGKEYSIVDLRLQPDFGSDKLPDDIRAELDAMRERQNEILTMLYGHAPFEIAECTDEHIRVIGRFPTVPAARRVAADNPTFRYRKIGLLRERS